MVKLCPFLSKEQEALKIKREFNLKTNGEMIHCKECEWYELDSGICKESEHDEIFGENDGCNHGRPKEGE